MPNEEEVGRNLKDCFGAAIASEVRFADWCKIGAFLSDSSRVLPQMAALDEEMYQRLCKKRLRTVEVPDRTMVTRAYNDYYQRYEPGKPKPELKNANIGPRTVDFTHATVSRLLTQVLSKFEAGKGFDFASGDFQAKGFDPGRTKPPNNTKKHTATYHGFVQAPDFRKQLVKRSHWKDPGAESVHGEFTHRIQWYAICRGLLMGVGEAAQVFESIGAYAGTFKGAKTTLYLWDALCDRTNQQDVAFDDELFKTEGAPGRSEDFRAPENLNCFLKDNEGKGEWRWPLLRDFLRARFQKRGYEVAKATKDARDVLKNEALGPVVLEMQYLGRKLYNADVLKDDAVFAKVLKMIKEGDKIWKF